jgi:hypothetical protein
MVIIVSSCIVSTFNITSPFAIGEPDKVIVNNETELKNAINNAPFKTSIVIVLNGGISLFSTLTIPADKNITLTRNIGMSFCRLVGPSHVSRYSADGTSTTIAVEAGGMLYVDGIVVTHEIGCYGVGVIVNSGGSLIMCSGEILDNHGYLGGGVLIDGGSFMMYGGKICRNDGSFGGGVDNFKGDFVMYGGEISNNDAFNGGGVYNDGVFTMFGGEISNNNAIYLGGGVYSSGDFVMTDGKISDNGANYYGGGVYNDGGNFKMVNSVISNNSVTYRDGGGVYSRGDFVMSGGEISGNTAVNGGGVFVYSGFFDLKSGWISDNVAGRNGGGVWVTNTNDFTDFNKLKVADGVVFSNNRATAAYNRDLVHDSLYNLHVGSRVTWSVPFIQGYNNYDISYTSGSLFDADTGDASDSDNGNGSSDSDGWLPTNTGSVLMSNGFSIICVSILFVVVGVVAGLYFVYFKKKVTQVATKTNIQTTE